MFEMSQMSQMSQMSHMFHMSLSSGASYAQLLIQLRVLINISCYLTEDKKVCKMSPPRPNLTSITFSSNEALASWVKRRSVLSLSCSSFCNVSMSGFNFIQFSYQCLQFILLQFQRGLRWLTLARGLSRGGNSLQRLQCCSGARRKSIENRFRPN